MKRVVIFLSALLCGVLVYAQEQLLPTLLNEDTHKDTATLTSLGILLTDDGTDATGGKYSKGHDYWYTVYGVCSSPGKLYLSIESFDVHPSDTLFFYDGGDTNAPLLLMANNSFTNILNRRVFISAANTTNMLTVRFKTSKTNNNTGMGFSLKYDCGVPCEYITPVINETFYRTRGGVVYDSAQLSLVELRDTATGEVKESFISANVCEGEGIMLKGHGVYTHHTGYYYPTDESSTFVWSIATGDVVTGVGQVTFPYDNFPSKACYEVTLTITDEKGCGGDMMDVIRIRIAGNPISTIVESLGAICNNDSLLVKAFIQTDSTVSEDAALVLNPTPSDVVSKTYEVRQFIPDGPNCPGSHCYEASIEFSEFPPGRTIQTAGDICSICINYEHSFMGDYDLKIKCPNGNEATLKYYQQDYNMPTGTGAGGSIYTGYPYGGSNDSGYDANGGSNCDTIYNMYGVGLDYCFSRNANYLLVDGLPANTTNTTGAHYLANSAYTINVTHTFDPIPAPYYGAGTTCGTSSFTTKKPSNHEDKYDYYQPADDFSSLIGCPLNGTWSVVICDEWAQDNGWVFGWSMDICGLDNASSDCQYTVGIDSIRWTIDEGLMVRTINNDTAYLSTPDTAGNFAARVRIYDDFGCVWDTASYIKSAWKPEPYLGIDRELCDPDSTIIDATDRHHNDGEFSYQWEPFGQTTAQIWTKPNIGVDTNYVVTVTNSEYGLSCVDTDTVRVIRHPLPVPGFTTNVIPPAGCSPFEIQFVDTSLYAYTYLWRFGDGFTSNLRNPYHTYAHGKYDVQVILTSDFGCVDSLTKQQYVWSFVSPDAQFSWDPEYPTYNSPQVQLINQTEPMVNETMYDWYIQSDASRENFYHTTQKEPSYVWSAPLVAGDYHVKLIAKTDNYDQNGTLVTCKDSVETTIMLIQDFIQFPTVVTPNGDGLNDKFVIHGLIEGLAYPNNTLHIYNRWGTLVYSKDNVRLEEECWDPAAERMPAGTYFYYFNARGYKGNVQRTGAVEVMKY